MAAPNVINKGVIINRLELMGRVMSAAGIPFGTPKIPTRAWCLTVVMIETGNFSSGVYTPGSIWYTYNNYSGIKPNKHGYQNGQNDFRDHPWDSPKIFGTYASPELWALDFKRILSMGANPLGAETAKDFYLRMYKNGYFTQSEAANYSVLFKKELTALATYWLPLFTNPAIDPSVDVAAARAQTEDERLKAQDSQATKQDAITASMRPKGLSWWDTIGDKIKDHPIESALVFLGLGIFLTRK